MARIKDLPKEQRPREKFLRQGPDAVSDEELLAILIGHGNEPNRDVFQIVTDILGGKKQLRALLGKTIQEIMKIKGLKEAKAIRLAAAVEIARRIIKSQENERLLFLNGTLSSEQIPLSQEFELKIPKRKLGKKANELDGKTWTRYSISVWSDIKKTTEEIKLGHPAIFPIQLPMRLIECFTTAKDKVILDPFVGTGSTVIAAKLLGKKGIGIDISQDFIELARERVNNTGLLVGPRENVIEEPLLICDDANNLLRHVDEKTVDLVVTSPPYWDILSQKRTADGREIKDYGEKEKDLAKIHDYKSFNKALQKIFKLIFKALEPGKYCIINVMDIRKGAKFYPFHSDVITFMEEIGFIFDDMIIWDRRNDYSNLRPLGFPSVFRINKIHEYLLIFKKPEKKI